MKKHVVMVTIKARYEADKPEEMRDIHECISEGLEKLREWGDADIEDMSVDKL